MIKCCAPALHDGCAGRRPMLGEIAPQTRALGDCEPGQEHRKIVEWEAKGVSLIMYNVPAGKRPARDRMTLWLNAVSCV